MDHPKGPSHHHRDTIKVEEWAQGNEYFEGFVIQKDEVLELARKNAKENGLPSISVSPMYGKLLNLIARTAGAKRILEVGTLGGHSAIWLARALPEDGEVVTFDINPKHAEVARKNLEIAGLSKKVTVVVGPAIDNLKELSSESKFDMAFIDADRESFAAYFTEAKRLVRSGGVILVDNVVLSGAVAGVSSDVWRGVEGVRDMLKTLPTDPEVECTVVGTTTPHGYYDGFLYAIRK